MHLVLLCLVMAVLFLIAAQDFQYRKIPVWMLIILIIINSFRNYLMIGWEALVYYTISNMLAGLSLFMLVWLYYVAKTGKIINILDSQIGTGDVILIMILGTGFSTLNFLLFLVSCFLFTLFLTLIKKMIYPENNQTIPLAGYLSLWYLLILFIIETFPETLLFKDTTLTDFLYL